MRLRVGLSLLLVAASLGLGCRKVIEPNIDRNRPPETWITAAPLDTIGGRGIDAIPGTIPFRFHLYWAGSDPDGEAAGFFFAVTETTAVGLPGEGIPRLPSPKPHDYKFTTKTDSIFIFNVVQGRPDRQHGFFIYAVDNEGKVDATPARFTFNAIDKYPPIPKFLKGEARGTIFTIFPGGRVDSVRFIRGPSWRPGMIGRPENLDDINTPITFPRDTVPSGSAFSFKWIGLPQAFGTYVVGYKYKFVEVEFTEVPATVDSVEYPAGSVLAGLHVFTLRAIDQANGSVDSTRRVVVNFSPDTWFAGPDTLCVAGAGSGFTRAPRGYYYRVMTGANRFPGSDPFNLPSVEIPCSTLGPSFNDADPKNWVNQPYADRKVMNSFFEWWEDTLYVRTEGATVHKNSILLFLTGGLDFDSPHQPLVPATPPPGVVPVGFNTQRGPANGSPIGFSGRVLVAQDPDRKGFLRPAESLTYPDYRIGTPFYRPVHVLRELARASGFAYARIRAVDGDGAKDNRIINPIDCADNLNCTSVPGATVADQLHLRAKVLTFYINQAPFLLTGNPSFTPAPNQLFTGTPVTFNLLADDPDPALIGESTEPGRKGQNKPLRRSVSFARDSSGVRVKSAGSPGRFDAATVFNVPTYWPAGPCDLEIQLCDCQFCETSLGEGRCVSFKIPIRWQP